MQKGAISVVPLIIGIAVAVVVATALFPTIWNAVSTPTGNNSPYSASVTGMLQLAPLLIALGIGLVGILLVLRTTGRK